MPWRLIGSILALAVVTVFIGFNLDNACDVSFGFWTVPRVPVYLSILASFVAGMLAVLPIAFGYASKRKKRAKTLLPSPSTKAGAAGRGGKRGKAVSKDADLDDGSYGVD